MKAPRISYLEKFLCAHCWLCQQLMTSTPSSYLCSHCENSLSRNSKSCRLCATPLTSELAMICAACQKKVPVYDQCISALKFEGEVKEMLHAFKYNERIDLGKVLSLELARAIAQEYAPNKTFNTMHTTAKPMLPTMMIPVPLHRSHLRRRGFNQAQEICKLLSKHNGIPYQHNWVFRNKNTESQHTLNAKQRKQNLKNAFSINQKMLKKLQQHNHIAIVDDVVTTSSTCNELSRILKHAGIKKIDVWALARASRNN